MKITELKQYEFASDLKVRNMGETTMVYNPQNGDMYEMNETAAILIEYLMQKLTGEEIVRKICEEYDVEPEVVIEDLQPLFDRLCEMELIIPEV